MAVSNDLDILSWLDGEESVKPAQEGRSAKTVTLTSEEVNGTCFEIQREVLLNLLEKAIGVVPTRDMVPIYNNFQFIVTEDGLTVVGASLEASITVTTSQIITKVAGIEIFPARTLFNLVKECDTGSTIYIEVTAHGAVVVAGSFSAEIALAGKGKDFPTRDLLNEVTFYSVDRIKFLDAIATVKYALPGRDHSGQATLKMINIKGGKFTACDGSRFQQARIDGFKLNMKVPTFSISNLIKILSTTDQETIQIGETDNDLVFKLANTVFAMNKLNDPYPNVEQLWLRPALSNDQALTINRQELISAIKKLKVIADTESNVIGFMLEVDKVKIVARGVNDSAHATLACTWTGKPVNVVVNYIHLAEMLKAYTLETCVFMLGEDSKSHKSPILLKNDETQAIATIPQVLSYRAGLL